MAGGAATPFSPAFFMTYSGTLELDRGGYQTGAIIDLAYAPSLAAVETFAATAHSMTTARISKATFTEALVLEAFPVSTGQILDLEYGAHFKFRRGNPTNDVYFRNFRLPGPKMEIFDLIEGKGYRIKTSYGNQMAAALSVLWQEPLTFDSGWLVH